MSPSVPIFLLSLTLRSTFHYLTTYHASVLWKFSSLKNTVRKHELMQGSSWDNYEVKRH